MANILVFGDSTAYGAWDIEGGWVARLRKYLDQSLLEESGEYNLVYNLSVSGDTSTDVLKRFEFEVSNRLDDEEETIILFSIGINDTQCILGKSFVKIPLNQFDSNIKKLVKKAKMVSSKVVFLGFEMVDEAKTNPIEWDSNKSYRNDLIIQYDQALKSICKQEQVHFIDLRTSLKALNYQKLMEDGLHPNAEGHKKIFEIVKNYLVDVHFFMRSHKNLQKK